MGEGLVLKLLYSPVCAGNFSVELVSGNNLFIPPSPACQPRCKAKTVCKTELQYQSINDQRRGWESELSSWAVIWGLEDTKETVLCWYFLVNMESLRETVPGLHNSYSFGNLCMQWSSPNDCFRIQSS